MDNPVTAERRIAHFWRKVAGRSGPGKHADLAQTNVAGRAVRCLLRTERRLLKSETQKKTGA